ncbi:uncharacterized protein LOC133525238 isoform X3 [Cydia pomonella]|uniref:uncharacterized protein LOC133525238 isoform X3 n=1 Tax=Cydia pomonella TaxID=82600 RepID=UPI002ADD4F38|nr:uncharacterized protein LOC133525238 isoform X3 [Cydia pomonella]
MMSISSRDQTWSDQGLLSRRSRERIKLKTCSARRSPPAFLQHQKRKPTCICVLGRPKHLLSKLSTADAVHELTDYLVQELDKAFNESSRSSSAPAGHGLNDAERRPLLQESETAEYPHSPPEQRRSLRASQLRLYKMLLLPEQPQQPLNPPELLAAQQRWRSAVAAAQQHRRFIGEIGP